VQHLRDQVGGVAGDVGHAGVVGHQDVFVLEEDLPHQVELAVPRRPRRAWWQAEFGEVGGVVGLVQQYPGLLQDQVQGDLFGVVARQRCPPGAQVFGQVVQGADHRQAPRLVLPVACRWQVGQERAMFVPATVVVGLTFQRLVAVCDDLLVADAGQLLRGGGQ
jgi:hypothetical protein